MKERTLLTSPSTITKIWFSPASISFGMVNWICSDPSSPMVYSSAGTEKSPRATIFSWGTKEKPVPVRRTLVPGAAVEGVVLKRRGTEPETTWLSGVPPPQDTSRKAAQDQARSFWCTIV